MEIMERLIDTITELDTMQKSMTINSKFTQLDFEDTLTQLTILTDNLTEVAAKNIDIDVDLCMERYDKYLQSYSLQQSQEKALLDGLRDNRRVSDALA